MAAGGRWGLVLDGPKTIPGTTKTNSDEGWSRAASCSRLSHASAAAGSLAAFAPLRRETERHEGIGGAQNSHYGIAARELARTTVLRDIEQVVLQGATTQKVGVKAYAAWDRWKDSVLAVPQKAFDDDERPQVPKWLGDCEFDYSTPRQPSTSPQ